MMGSYFALSDKSYGPMVIRDAIGLAYAMGKSDGKLELANSQIERMEKSL